MKQTMLNTYRKWLRKAKREYKTADEGQKERYLDDNIRFFKRRIKELS